MYIDAFYSSPYRRSIDTIKESAASKGMRVNLDERLRERESGPHGHNLQLFRRRWTDFDFHEENGESLHRVQKRNIEALSEILKTHKDGTVVIGTHGTALSSILNHYHPAFGCDDFIRIIDLMPYVIMLDFYEGECTLMEELLMIKKEFQRKT